MNIDRFLSGLLQREVTPAERNAVLFTLLALALMLAYYFGGSRGFFLTRIAPALSLSHASADLAASFYQFGAAFVLFFIVPLAVVKSTTGTSLVELNLGLGDRRQGFLIALAGLLIISLPSAFFASLDPQFLREYPLAKSAVDSPARLLAHELAYGLLYYVAWEGFFRGILQSELTRFLGLIPALLIQTSASTLIHIGKPVTEVWASLFAGIAFGIAVIRTRSIWPLVFVHWALGVATDLACAYAAGIWP